MAAGPLAKTAPDEGVQDAVGVAADKLTFAERKHVDPVGVELVSGVEGSDALLGVGIPGVDDVVVQAEEAADAGSTDAFGVGRNVDGLGERIVEVKLEAVCHLVAQGGLQSVVVGPGNGTPGVE